MPVFDAELGSALGVQRGDVVVAIPLYGAHHFFTRCLSSVLAHTPADVPILVADDHGPDPASRAWVDDLAARGVLDEHRVHWLRRPRNAGFVDNVNGAFDACAPADVVIVNSDCEVAEGWLDGLREAAYSDSTIASASALTNHGSILSLPQRNRPSPRLPDGLTLDVAAARVRAQSLRLRPRIPTAIGHCAYIRRDALELVGGFDTAFAPAYGEEVDWSQRAALAGLGHVAADDVFVLHHGGGSLNVEGKPNPIQKAHEAIIEARHPHYTAAVKDAEGGVHGPLPRALAVARRALVGVDVTVDGRCLGPVMTGTQVQVLELIVALARRDDVRLRIITPPNLGDVAQALLDGLPGVIPMTAHEAVAKDVPRTAVVHRPWQVTEPADLVLLRNCGERVVVTHLDLIAYHNSGYHASARDWMQLRRLTRLALASADLVVFMSEHAARDAQAEELVSAERSAVVPIGVDHRLSLPDAAGPPARPAGTERLGADGDVRPYLLCLGTDFRHKNRVFALHLLERLRTEHAWDGVLVFAGPSVSHGSSAGEEAEYLTARPELASHVVNLAAVSEPEKAWLYANAAGSLYPTTFEGFGLVPFEAAGHGVPSFFPSHTSLSEVLDGVPATLVPWDVEESARRVHAVVSDPARRDELLGALREAAARYTWDATAAGLVDVYSQAIGAPSRIAGEIALDALEIEAERGEWEGRYWHLRNQVGSTGMALVGEGGHLPDETQRALAALAQHKATRKPLLAALRTMHKVGTRGRDGDTPPAPPSAGELAEQD